MHSRQQLRGYHFAGAYDKFRNIQCTLYSNWLGLENLLVTNCTFSLSLSLSLPLSTLITFYTN